MKLVKTALLSLTVCASALPVYAKATASLSISATSAVKASNSGKNFWQKACKEVSSYAEEEGKTAAYVRLGGFLYSPEIDYAFAVECDLKAQPQRLVLLKTDFNTGAETVMPATFTYAKTAKSYKLKYQGKMDGQKIEVENTYSSSAAEDLQCYRFKAQPESGLKADASCSTDKNEQVDKETVDKTYKAQLKDVLVLDPVLSSRVEIWVKVKINGKAPESSFDPQNDSHVPFAFKLEGQSNPIYDKVIRALDISDKNDPDELVRERLSGDLRSYSLENAEAVISYLSHLN